MSASEMIREYLNDPARRDLIKVEAIERAADMPKTTLKLYLTGHRQTLPGKHLPRLVEVIKNLGFKEQGNG